MSRILTLLLVVSITSQAACGNLSENNRRGMLLAGGAAAFIGGVITMDGLSCDETPTRSQACEEDRTDLAAGAATMLAGAALVGLALYLDRQAAKAPAPAPP